MKLDYKDTATFVEIGSGGYSNNKSVVEQEGVPVIFIQNTGFTRSAFKDNVTSDAICFPDPTNSFIVDHANRLEGMLILAPLFDVDNDDGWYKVESVTVNRDHLLQNKIDNIELALKKSHRVAGVS